MTKLVFILPSYSQKAASHYPYLVEQLRWLKTRFDLKVVIEKQLSPLPGWLQSMAFIPSNPFKRFLVLHRLKRQGYRRIYIHYSHFSLIMAKVLGLTTYFWHCEKFARFPLSYSPREYLLNTWPLLLAFRLTDYLVTGDQVIKQAYHQRFSIPVSKIKLVPNWTFFPSKGSGPKDLTLKKRKIVLFVHHLSVRKGSRLLPEIIKKVSRKDPGAFFIIIGSGPDQNWLAARLKKLPAKLVGSVPRSKLDHYYRQADLFILPSLQEGFPRVVLEGMAFKLPLVSFDVGNVKNLIPDTMIVNSVNQFVDKIVNQPLRPVNYPRLKNYSFSSWQQAFLKLFK